ncbi:limonene-1,2-epoxide hydrolase family protein [Nocardioides sp. BP30]|uniref:limonene-1,2-epoxide hydrolase family protein n=1 Tax=Nocardioides sp. BP30 TaxID=3036374 RepID=UPI0024698955|nr:limonene-1,2-epoxide hydrolase family protein [Nocardioides sp. BP30]WGL50916.1 limonene-1,2-epoxide hydrolase family protein [Nocardioides sp. BP30]
MTDSTVVVRDFLSLLENGRAAEAVEMLTPDAQWRNTGLPTLRGRRMRRVLLDLERRHIRFRADMHHLAADGDVVLTDRTDFLRIGRWEASFWVCGTFHVRAGRIELWDDHYAMGNVLAGSLVGLAKMVTRR